MNNENTFLYDIVNNSRLFTQPINLLVNSGKNIIREFCVSTNNQNRYYNYAYAMYEIIDRLTKDYGKLKFNIDRVLIGGEDIEVEEKIIDSKPFAKLINFKKKIKITQPKLLIVAPMAGHHATLLRDAVKNLLPYFDLYITDWEDAKYVPIEQGSFDMDDYIDYLIDYYQLLGPKLNVMAVCQPTVTVIAATAIMEQRKDKNVPSSMILIGGPIDTRFNPTQVNKFAENKDINWFKSNVITKVPSNYPGAGRLVYPGFVQVAGFISMNVDRHIGSHIDMFNLLTEGNYAGARKQKDFYDEYLSVMDLTAEFFLQTIDKVFIEHDLPRKVMFSRDRYIDLSLIKTSHILAIEGESDDITGIGQTKAILKLCDNLDKNKKLYYLQEDAGHYGVFSGSKFRENIVPLIKNYIYKIHKCI